MIKAEEIRHDVYEQIKKDNRIDFSDINVQILGGTVVLSGTVKTFDEIEGAEAAAYKAQGVITVENELKIKYKPQTEIRREKKE